MTSTQGRLMSRNKFWFLEDEMCVFLLEERRRPIAPQTVLSTQFSTAYLETKCRFVKKKKRRRKNGTTIKYIVVGNFPH